MLGPLGRAFGCDLCAYSTSHSPPPPPPMHSPTRLNSTSIFRRELKNLMHRSSSRTCVSMLRSSLWLATQETEGKFAAHFNGRRVCGVFPSLPSPLILHTQCRAHAILLIFRYWLSFPQRWSRVYCTRARSLPQPSISLPLFLIIGYQNSCCTGPSPMAIVMRLHAKFTPFSLLFTI
jgi:hypothetical protein